MRLERNTGAMLTRSCCGRYPMPQPRRLTSAWGFAKNGNNISSLEDF